MSNDSQLAMANVAVLRIYLKWTGSIQMLGAFVLPPLWGSQVGPVVARVSALVGTMPCAVAACVSAALLLSAQWLPRLRVFAGILYSFLCVMIGLVGWSASPASGVVFVFGFAPIGIALASVGVRRGQR